MKFKDFISGDDTLNLIQDILKQNNYTFTVKKNKIIVSASDRFGALQNFVKLFSQLNAVYNPEGSGSSLGRVEIKSPQNKTFYIFAKPTSGSGLTANRGNQFEIDFSKALESYINGDSVDKKYLDAIEEIESISKKDGFHLNSISNDGALNQKRPFVFTSNGIVCGSKDFDIGKTVTDITLTYSNSNTEYKKYLSLKFGSSVTFANIGVSKYLKSSEIQEGEIKNSHGKALLNMFCIDEKMFCDAFNSYIERAERVRKAKKIQVDVTNELKNSREFSDFIKSVIGYGYILVHKIGSNIHCLDMTESVLDKLVKVKKAVVLYPSGDAKRVDILVELNGLKLKFNFRNKSGGIYPSHLLADYSFI